MSIINHDIYHTIVGHGVALAWVNSYSAVVLKTPGATLLFDPVGMDVPEDACLDLIAVTHGHLDHWDAPLVTGLQQRTGAIVAASPYIAKLLNGLGEVKEDAITAVSSDWVSPDLDQDGLNSPRTETPDLSSNLTSVVRPVQPGDEITIGDVTVTALRCDHAAVEPLAYQVRTADGITVYLPGDTTPFPEMGYHPGLPYPEHLLSATLDGRKPETQVDVLFWTGTALKDGAKIARLVNPKLFLSYAISPPAARPRAYGILTGLAPEVPFHALDRHQVFLYPVPCN